LQVASDLVDLLGLVRPNCQTRVRGLSMELGLAAVRDEVNFEPGLQCLVMDCHQFLFAVHSATDFGKRSGKPFPLSIREIVK